MTAEERAFLLKLVEEESAELFGKESGQTKRQRKITSAVKMAILGGAADEEN
jgi:hypothetical protein